VCASAANSKPKAEDQDQCWATSVVIYKGRGAAFLVPLALPLGLLSQSLALSLPAVW
jgi:hypothetical protein